MLYAISSTSPACRSSTGLNNLLLLNISRNDISSHLLSHQIFDSLMKLVALDLSLNALTELHGELLNISSLQIVSTNQL